MEQRRAGVGHCRGCNTPPYMQRRADVGGAGGVTPPPSNPKSIQNVGLLGGAKGVATPLSLVH